MSTDLPLTAGGAIFRRLHDLGVERVFVNSGTDFPPIVEGLAEAEHLGLPVPRAIVVPHEHVAVSMAHGHYFATGACPAVILHTNVGLANGAIGAINAAIDHVPMILMSGRTPTVEAGRFGARTVPIGWGQEMRDQAALVREACKWDYEVRFPEQIPELLDRAYAIANSTPKGPVYLSLPREVLCEPCPAPAVSAPISMRPSTVTASVAEIDQIADALRSAERPLIIAQRGTGSEAAFTALADVADRASIPVCQWWAVATAISADHEMNIGPNPEPWISEADVVVVLNSLAPWMPDAHGPAPDANVIHVGPDPLFHRIPVRNFRADLAVTSEVAPALLALSRSLGAAQSIAESVEPARHDWRLRVVEAHHRWRTAEVAVDSLTKASVGAALGRALERRPQSERHTVVSELGAPLGPLALTTHDSWRQEPHSGGLGWGLPCAIGMKLADPDRLVVATMGDGSYMFANPVAAHHVAEAHGIGFLTVIVNNAGYGAVRDSIVGLYPTGYAAKADDVPLTGLSPSPDFTLVAQSCRAWAETVTEAAELAPAIDRALAQVDHGRQAVLDVRIVA